MEKPNTSILHMLKSFFEANCTFLFPMCFVCVCARVCACTCLWRPQFVINCFTSPFFFFFWQPLSLNLELTNCVYFLTTESLGFACFCPQALHSSAQQMHSTHPGFSMDLKDTSSGPQAFTAFPQVSLPYPEVTTSHFHINYALCGKERLCSGALSSAPVLSCFFFLLNNSGPISELKNEAMDRSIEYGWWVHTEYVSPNLKLKEPNFILPKERVCLFQIGSPKTWNRLRWLRRLMLFIFESGK